VPTFIGCTLSLVT